MTIRPLSLLTAGLFFLGGFLLVLPTQWGPDRDTQAKTETALTGFSPVEGEFLLQSEEAPLFFDELLQEESTSGGASQDLASADEPAAAEAHRPSSKDRKTDSRGMLMGKLMGRVLWGKSRIPVSGIGLRLYVRFDGESSSSLGSPEELDAPGSPYLMIGEGSCDGRGEFELVSRATQGQICLVVCAGEDRVGVFSLSMAPQPGEVFDLGDLNLEETGKAVGRVLDAEGKPLKDAWVRVTSTETLLDYELDGLLLIREPEQRIVTVPDWVKKGSQSVGPGRSRTDDQGFFVVDRVAAGPARVSVQADQHLPHHGKLEISPGQTSDLGEISMPAGLSLGGQLVDHRGLPVREAQVSVGSTGRSLVIPKLEAHVMSRPVFTDDEGRFRVGGLAEGELFVAWRPSSEFDWQVLGPFLAGADLRLRVDSPFLVPSSGLQPEGGLTPGVPDGGR